MIPVLYESDKMTFTNNGLGGLPHALSCTVTREANKQGGYFLDMEYPTDGLHYKDLKPERLILAAPAPELPPQPFRISRITPNGKTASIYAPHVSDGMSKITSYGIHTGQNIQGMIYNYMWQARQLGQENPFWLTTDITTDRDITFTQPEPKSLLSILLGSQGSVLDTIGGEFEFDAWHVILHKQAGRDTGYEIREGANIISVRAETDDSALVTAVLPYYKGSQDGQDVFVYGSICRASTAGDYQLLRCVPLDVSGNFTGLEDGALPTAAEVTAQGQAFIDSSDATTLRTSYEVEYIPTPPDLSGITPAPARHLYLFDRAKVVLPSYGLSAPAKVVKTVHNVLLNRYNSVTVGTIERNAADTIAALISKTNNQQILW